MTTGPAAAPVAFGSVFTDHMVGVAFADHRWGEPWIARRGPISVDPAASGLHYGQAVFEGLKAYRQPNRDVAFFRIRDHGRRFQASAAHMGMPPLPVELFVDACFELVGADEAFVPDEPGNSLYVRPLMLATTPRLGVRRATDYLCIFIASPVGDYHGGADHAWTVKAEREHVRATIGGTGAAKCAGNYGASLAARTRATTASGEDFDEVLFLDAAEHRWVQELSAMNVFVVEMRPGLTPTLVTPPLAGTILAGITRASLLELAPALGYRALTAPISLDRWRHDAEHGIVTEAFATGTGAVVAPIGRIDEGSRSWTVGDGQPGPITRRLRATLLDVQEGRAPDDYGWRSAMRLRGRGG